MWWNCVMWCQIRCRPAERAALLNYQALTCVIHLIDARFHGSLEVLAASECCANRDRVSFTLCPHKQWHRHERHSSTPTGTVQQQLLSPSSAAATSACHERPALQAITPKVNKNYTYTTLFLCCKSGRSWSQHPSFFPYFCQLRDFETVKWFDVL